MLHRSSGKFPEDAQGRQQPALSQWFVAGEVVLQATVRLDREGQSCHGFPLGGRWRGVASVTAAKVPTLILHCDDPTRSIPAKRFVAMIALKPRVLIPLRCSHA